MQEDSPIRVYFLGSGGEGVPVLQRLLDDPAIQVAGIGTQPDRPAGRNRRPRPTPVAQFAETCGRSVEKPASVNSPDFLERLRRLDLHILVVVSFGQILKPPLLALPRRRCLNVHLSLLPRHRGAAPVAAAILAGDAEAGVSFMQMDEGLDTGPVYRRIPIPLSGRETTPELSQRLASLAAEHIAQVLTDIVRNGLAPVPQNEAEATYARKIRKQDARIRWQRPAIEIERAVRAYLPWPRAWFQIQQGRRIRRIQVTAAQVVHESFQQPPGCRIPDSENQSLTIACGAGALRILRLIPEGKSEMEAREFLRGARDFQILADND